MKLLKLLMLSLVGAFWLSSATGQANANINVLTLNSGQVAQGGVVDVQVTVGNTGPASQIGVNKVRAQISIPIAIATALPNAQQTGLPPGWTILSNTGGVIQVCNGSDIIPVGQQRQVFIKVQGLNIGGPSTVAGVLSFGPGTGVCTGLGMLSGNSTADDVSQSTIQVIAAPACSIAASAAGGTISCNGGTTTLTATATGANGAVEYSVNGGAYQSGNTFTVPAGTYTVTAREVSNPSCNATATPVTITQPSQLVAAESHTAILCFGGTSTVTISATGGTAPYSGTGTFTQPAGTQSYTVTDANGCTSSVSVTVSEGPSSAVVASSTVGGAILCNGGTTTVTVSATGGTAPYSGTGTFTVSAGAYSFTVTDANGCTATTTGTVSQPPVLLAGSSAPPITLPGGSTTVTVNASGGTPPYTGTGTFVRTAGTYTFTVTDANGCTANTTITISDPVAGPANASINVLTLNSGQVAQGGVVDVQVTVGNTGPSFIGGNKVRAQISIPIAIATALPNAQQTGLPAGWTILSNTGGVITVCNGTDVIPAGQQRQIFIKVQGTTVGGPSTVSGVLSFGPGTGVCTGLGSLPGNLTSDDVSQSTIQVIGNCNIGVTASAGTIACFGGTTTLTAVATGASGAVEYSVNGGAYQSGNTFTVPAGTYTVTAREVDNQSCTSTSSAVTVTEPSQLVASSSATAILCNGGSSTVTVSATGGTAPYTGTGTFTVTAGTYTYTVTDANGCTAVTSITVSEPAVLVASSGATAILCNGGSSTVTVSATGGTAPYTGTGTFTVTAGTYAYTVTDANGCTSSVSVTITQPAAITVTAISTPDDGGSNGTATATAVGGTSPYTYLWAPGGQTTQTATGLAAGTYTVTVTDANGCTATATTTVTAGCGVIVSAGPDQELCPGGTVTLTATATGGNTSGGAPQPVPFTEVSGSTAEMRIFSGNIDQITIGNTFSQAEDRTNCNKNASSSKTLTIPSGAVVKKAYLYWSGSGNLDNQVKLNGTSVTADGTKTYTRSRSFKYFAARKDVTSMISASGSYTVSDLNWNNGSPYCYDNSAYGGWALTVVYEQSALPSARIHVNTEKFQYTYPGGTYSTTINNINVPAGCTPDAKLTFVAFEGDSYKKEVLTIAGVQDLDSNNFRGQSGPNLDIITKNAPSVTAGTTSLTYSIKTFTQNTVYGSAIEGLFDYVKVLKYNNCSSGGCNGYTYEWKKNGTVVGTTQSIIASSTGTYTVKATDCAGCTATDDVVVTASTLAATATAGTINCNGGTTSVTVSATGGTAPYTGTGTFTKGAGTWSFTVTDAKGCTSVATVTISQPAALVASATAPAIACGGTTTTVTVSATGGTAPYIGTGTFTKGPGTWSFTVTDAKGCYSVVTITIANPVACGPVDPNKCYKLVARHSGKAATVKSSSTSNGGNVEQRSYSGGSNQIWKFAEVETGFYKVTNENSGKVLDVSGASTSNGANVHQWTWSNGNNQKWSLTANGAYFVVKAKHSGKAMSVAGSSGRNGANVEQRGTGTNYNEQWSIVEVGCPFITKGPEVPTYEVKGDETPETEMTVTVLPNPSRDYFTLNVKGKDLEKSVSVRILDINGKVLATYKTGINTSLKVGDARWANGTYFAEVIHGNERKVVRLIKAN